MRTYATWQPPAGWATIASRSTWTRQYGTRTASWLCASKPASGVVHKVGQEAVLLHLWVEAQCQWRLSLLPPAPRPTRNHRRPSSLGPWSSTRTNFPAKQLSTTIARRIGRSRCTYAASGQLNPLAVQRASAASAGVQKMRLEGGELVVAPENRSSPS